LFACCEFIEEAIAKKEEDVKNGRGEEGGLKNLGGEKEE